MLSKLLPPALALCLLSGCAGLSPGGYDTGPVQMVDTSNDRGQNVTGLDYRDFQAAASTMTQSMLASPNLVNPKGGRYVMTISDIKNDTMQRIDVAELVETIRDELRESGKVAVTTAIGVNGPEDRATAELRELRGNSMVRQSTVKGDNQVVAPDVSLAGRISQKNVPMPNGATQIEYYFRLSLTDLATGVELWGKQTRIVKRSNQSTVTW